MRAMDLDNVEAGGERPARGLGEGVDKPLDFRDGEFSGHGIAFALWQRRGADRLPCRLLAALVPERGGSVPRALGAGPPARVSELDSWDRALGTVCVGNPLQPRDLAILPDAGAAVGYAAMARDAGGLDERGRQAAGGE